MLHEVVDRFAHLGALAVAEPADARGQSLECETAAGKAHPAGEDFVFREELKRQFIGTIDVLRIAGERDPAERALRRCRRADECTRARSRE